MGNEELIKSLRENATCGMFGRVQDPVVEKLMLQAADALEAIGTPEVKCDCEACRPITLSDMRFNVCQICGNKRCPHACDHRNACTGSNEPGQIGSAEQQEGGAA